MLWTKPAPTGSGAFTNTIGTVRGSLLQWSDGRTADGHDHVRRESYQLRRIAATTVGIAADLTNFDLEIAADHPP